MKNIKIILPALAVLLVCLAVIYVLYPRIHPLAGIPVVQDHAAIEEQADRLADLYRINQDGLSKHISIQQRTALLEYLQKQSGLEASIGISRQDAGIYFYEVSWDKDGSFGFGSDSAREKARMRNLRIGFDLHGRLLEMELPSSDSAAIKPLTRKDAFQTIVRLLGEYSPYQSIREDTSALPRIKNGKLTGRSADRESPEQISSAGMQELALQCTLPGLSIPVWLHTGLTGGQVIFVRPYFDLPQPVRNKNTQSIIEGAAILVLMIIIVVAFFITIKRYRAYELGFQLAIALGILGAILKAASGLTSLPDQFGWPLLLSMMVIPFFYGFGIMLMWLPAETIGRSVWPDRFTGFDLLLKGHLLHSRAGVLVMQGLAAGTLALALNLSLVYLAGFGAKISFFPESSEALQFLVSPEPALTLLTERSAAMIYLLATMVVLLTSLLKNFIRPAWIVYFVAAVLSGFFIGLEIRPYFISIAIHTAVAFIFILTFVKSDSLAAWLALIMYSILNLGLSLLFSGGSLPSVFLILLLPGALIVYSISSCLTRDSVTDLKEITPAFVRYINERQRLQRELEIARDVQMSFLPAGMPEFMGLDISARCLPALEVGGDYYDFVELDERRLAVAMGDVSGKGAQAAFYMTLTKGFLQAVARDVPSASEVLKRMNRLFYENARRNTFISLVYGIFDLQGRVLHLARAGHDLVIKFDAESGAVSHLKSSGLALGLERGAKFNEVIEELHIPFQKGDSFIFYTDGLTEARNRDENDFGLERLEKIIMENGSSGADVLLNRIFDTVSDFSGRAPRHDDLSVLVVKIAE
jgi:hypothetical protein